MDAGAVAKNHALRQPAHEVVHAGRDRLHHADIVHALEELRETTTGEAGDHELSWPESIRPGFRGGQGGDFNARRQRAGVAAGHAGRNPQMRLLTRTGTVQSPLQLFDVLKIARA